MNHLIYMVTIKSLIFFICLQACLSAFENRGVKIGKAMYRELTGLKKPVLDQNNILHWPVLLLYAEAMTSDFVEDFCETDMFATHLDMISFFQKLISIISIDLALFSSVSCPSLALRTCFQRIAHLCHGIKTTSTRVKQSSFTTR